MKQQLAWVAVIAVHFLATGCATIRGDKQKMTISSDPSAARLTVDGQQYTTPAQVVLKRKDVHRITVEKDGYQPIGFDFAATWDGAAMTDFAVPGGSALVGASVVTGSDRQFNQLATIKLEPVTSASKPTPREMYQYHGRLLQKAEYDQAVKEELENKAHSLGPG